VDETVGVVIARPIGVLYKLLLVVQLRRIFEKGIEIGSRKLFKDLSHQLLEIDGERAVAASVSRDACMF